VPGTTPAGTRCGRTVNLLDLYPTLIDLCGLGALDGQLDGASLRPLLENPNARWARPSVTTHRQGCHAVRDERRRYIRYVDGTEELYDHKHDANEWHNLAGESEYAEVIKGLSKWLPKVNAPPVGKGPVRPQ
jgi:arylsulfatase A-like enzyme